MNTCFTKFPRWKKFRGPNAISTKDHKVFHNKNINRSDDIVLRLHKKKKNYFTLRMDVGHSLFHNSLSTSGH